MVENRVVCVEESTVENELKGFRVDKVGLESVIEVDL